MNKAKLDNISQLRTEIGNVFLELRERKIETHEAATLAKLADSMISSSKVELDYNKISNSNHKIDFLESTKK